MLKRMLAMGLTVGVAIGILMSCGSNPTTAPSPGSGALITLISDAAPCDVLSFRAFIDGLTLTAVGGAGGPAIIPTSQSYELNFGMLRDLPTVLNITSLTAGTYNEATMGLALVEMGVYDPSASPPVKTIGARLTTASPTFTIAPPLTITKGQVSVLRIDFNLVQSIGVDSNGQITTKVTPVIIGSPVTASGSQGFGELDDLLGFVRSVTPTSPDPRFLGSFLLQLLSGSLPQGPAPTVSLTESTELFGAPPLDQLLTGSFVEVDGYFDASGNLVANAVEVEYQEDLAQNKVALIGTITGLAKDSSGNLSEFDLWVRQEEPNNEADIQLNSIVAVNLSSSTAYQFSSRPVNFANLTFAPTTLALGQEVVVHGPYTKAAGQTTRVAADKVYLKLQPVQGSSTSIVQIGSDDRTGAFWLSPCMSLFQKQPILVLTNNQTTFLNLSGLSGLTTRPLLLVKGLLFPQPQGATINGVPVPPGTLVLLAKQVHQL
jgi:hypothetical protein